MSAPLLTAALTLLAQSTPVPVFPASLETVYVDVFVKRGETALAGLTAGNFQILDDGVAQPVRLVDQRAAGVSAVLVLDVSGSMEGRKLEELRLACAAFVDALGPHDQAAVLLVSQRLDLLVPPTDDRGRLRAAIAKLRAGGATALHDALYAAMRLEHGERRPLVVAFSDGQDNLSWLAREEVMRAAEAAPALLYGVGLGKLVLPPGAPGVFTEAALPAGMQFMQHLAESTGGRFWRAKRPQDLKDVFLQVLGETRDRYLLAYEPPGSPRPGYHQLEVRLRGAKGRVRARAGYRVPDKPPVGSPEGMAGPR